jgi:hypothetical protein
MGDEIRRVPPGQADVAEAWSRVTDEPEIRCVEAWTDDEVDGWVVEVSVQEFFRQDRLGVELRLRMQSALEAVEGVTDVAEQGTESWFVTGSPSGEALTRAAASVVDDLADRMREGMPA